MKSLRALLAGVAGALAMSAVMFILRQSGVNVSLESLLGSMFQGDTRMSPWMMGFLLHLGFGACMGLLYAFVFEVLQTSNPLVGGGLGVAHGLIVGLFMSGIPAMNPITPNPDAPGPFLDNMPFGQIIFLLLHFVFGATVSLVYGKPRHRPVLTPKRVA